MNKVSTMILAGGRGRRMGILCQQRPKPLLPFAGKYRVIDFVLSNCIHSGIRNIAVLVDYERGYLKDYIDDSLSWKPFASIDINTLEPNSGCYQGTADAVYRNRDYLQESNTSVVLVLAAEHVYKMDYSRMLAFHEHVEADVTVGVIPVPME